MFQTGQPQVFSQTWKSLYPVPGVFIFLGGTSSSKSFWNNYLAQPSIVPPPTTTILAPPSPGA